MTTMEQKIEKLLHDLDKYAQKYGGGDYGLPTLSFDVERMKAIVQDFVDNLKEDEADIKEARAWDENQLNAYRAFLEAGIPDEWAKAMAYKVKGVCDLGGKDAWEHAMEFALWEETREGFHFWDDVATEVAREGVSAFSKFKCPK